MALQPPPPNRPGIPAPGGYSPGSPSVATHPSPPAHADGGGCVAIHAHVPVDAATPAHGTAPAPVPAAPAPGPGARHPGKHRQRRVFADNRNLARNRQRSDLPNKHPLVGPERAAVRAKLRGKAQEFGLTLLPGEGSLSLATRYVPGGRDALVRLISLAAADADPDALLWLHVWNSLKPWEQHQVTLDDICAGAGLSPVKLLKIVVGTAFEAGCDVANLVAAASHPKVVQASVRTALTARGVEDRKLLFQHHHFIPVAKGATINVSATAQAQAAAQAQNGDDAGVPSFMDDVETVDVKALPPATAEIEHLWAEGETTDGDTGTD